LFPQYDSGVYSNNTADMVVSRGIGNSVFPVRFANRPEVILITLKA
jgi:predicted MPP superfamily phosphohydrolase